MLFTLSAVFFAFPLFAPAIGVVLYPFLLQGLSWAWTLRFRRLPLAPTLLLGCSSVLIGMIDPAGAFRLLAFALAVLFLHATVDRTQRVDFLLKLGLLHAWIVLAQWLLVVSGIPLDFSSVFRAIYGGLLPPTGIHIDYNAFSQIDFYFPRVAGLNREPAFGCLLFAGLGFVAWRLQRRRAALVFGVAVLCTLSKILFPIVLAFAFSGLGRIAPRRAVGAYIVRLALFIGLHLATFAAIWYFAEALELAMAFDASFYHRLIGPRTLAFQSDAIAFIGNSVTQIARDPIFVDYEFLNDPRAFLDGSVVAKLAVDIGWLAVAVYALIATWARRSNGAIVSIFIAGLFINLLSVSPATVMVFWIATGLWRDVAALHVSATRTAARRRTPRRASSTHPPTFIA